MWVLSDQNVEIYKLFHFFLCELSFTADYALGLGIV